MTWLSNSVTHLKCDSDWHDGTPMAVAETSYTMTAREALIRDGWGYNHDAGIHICPKCVARNKVSRKADR